MTLLKMIVLYRFFYENDKIFNDLIEAVGLPY